MNNGNQAPPPAYGFQRPINTLTRVQPRSLRLLVIIFTVIGCICAAAYGVKHLKYINDRGETSSMKIFDVIIGAMYLLIAFIELTGFLAAIKNTARLVRIYAFLSVGSILLAAAGGITEIIGHFVLKEPRQAQCIVDSTGEFQVDSWFGQGRTITYNAIQAADYCRSTFSRNTWYLIIWLLAAIFFSSMASIFSFAYARQLANPSAFVSGGGLRPAHDQGMPLQPFQSRQPEDYVPPYPGPPPNESPYESDTKSPTANSSFMPVSAEDEAWNRSLAESERREWEQHNAALREGQHGRGEAGRNEAEDEAWEEARRGASTAGGSLNNPFAPRDRRREDQDEGGRV